ncbi:acyl-CoA carboxylase subunit epsilon [[Kitasatospora] papulosa]|uniref:acyl-CoA carboxylase subunit epsilon n=1 Tax=[Kitasatospora] papulosa TaxID=1464011 RepID=UPI00367D0DB4
MGGIGRMESERMLLRVERGHAEDEELAALTAVLVALCAGSHEASSIGPTAGSHQWRSADVYTAPHSWR